MAAWSCAALVAWGEAGSWALSTTAHQMLDVAKSRATPRADLQLRASGFISVGNGVLVEFEGELQVAAFVARERNRVMARIA